MRLNLHAKTASKTGYTPDWIAIEFRNQGKNIRLTMGIQGDTNYNEEKRFTQTTGEIYPSEYRVKQKGKAKNKDLFQLSEEKLADYLQMFNHMLSQAERVIVGVYPTDNTNYQEKLKTLDPSKEFTDCTGLYEYEDNFENNHSIEFKFECEVY